MFTRLHLLVLFLLLSFPVAAQKITLSLNVGVGTYAMNDFKKLQKQLQSQNYLNPTITDEFPPYLFYEGTCHAALTSSIFTGVSVAYGSTGGRIQYRDYSGYVRADQSLRYINVSIPVGYRFNIGEKLTLGFDLKPTYTQSHVDIAFEQQIAAEYEKEEHKFNSKSFAIQPEIFLMRKFGRFGIQAQISYYQGVKQGNLYYEDDTDAYLIDDRDDAIYAGWEGLRLSIGGSFLIGKN